jgi:hypothetical protein
MHTAIVMRKTILFILAAVLTANNVALPTKAEVNPPHIVISELQTGGTSDATEEFVELYNPSETTVDVTGWLLQYRAASGQAGQSWPTSTTKATIACATGSAPTCRAEMLPKTRLVLTHTIANIAGALNMSGGFSDKGGEIRLVQPGTTPIVHDFIGYGTAADAEGTPAAAPAAGQSIKRVLDANDAVMDTDNNATDFLAACGSPTPGQADTLAIPYASGCVTPPLLPETPSQTAPPDGTTPGDSANPPDGDTDGANHDTPLTYLPILITEVLPNPASPQTDSANEFIELYNPNDTAVTLSNYRLQTGTDYRYTYTLGDTPLAPHAYLAIPSAVSKLSLANSGSGVRLINPNGLTVAEVPNYGDAKEGQSWMQDETGWHWSLTPTPYAANILTLPAPKITPLASSAPKKASTAKTAVPKVNTAKTTTPKAPAVKKTTSPASTAGSAPSQQSPAIQYWLLIPLAALALGYVIYEYRENIARAWRRIWSRNSKKQVLADDN